MTSGPGPFFSEGAGNGGGEDIGGLIATLRVIQSSIKHAAPSATVTQEDIKDAFDLALAAMQGTQAGYRVIKQLIIATTAQERVIRALVEAEREVIATIDRITGL